MEEVTKEQFLSVYNSHPPKGWIKWAFKYFSKSTEKENMKLSKNITWVLATLFVVGFIATVVKLPQPIIWTVTIIYTIVLSSLVLFLYAANLANNIRIRTIAWELNVTLVEYNKLVDKYFK